MLKKIKEQVGCWVHERKDLELVLRGLVSKSWLDLCNRHERLSLDTVSGGRVCLWRDSSHLTLGRVFPQSAARLLSHALVQWPIEFNFERSRVVVDSPVATALVAIGGSGRLSQLLVVLAALRAQSLHGLEIIVVEQGPFAELTQFLPGDVIYVHDAYDISDGFNKSRALNIGARRARGEYLLIHDGDYLVPKDYAAECVRVLHSITGVRPGRMNFHLDQASTNEVIRTRGESHSWVLECVVQNNPTPMATTKRRYWEVGGHDESFIGWGGEDVEFLSRLRTQPVCEGGWLPIIHLWHPPAAKKASGHRNQQQQDELLAVDPFVRIRRLTQGL